MSTSTSERSTETGPVYQNFIGGQWKNAHSGETFISTNPARTSQIIGHYQKSRSEDLDEAVAAAVAAQPSWAATPAPRRGEILYRAAQMLTQRREELAELMTCEMGKTLKETRGEVDVTIDVAKFMASEAKRAEGEMIPSALPEKMCLTLRHPLGVVGLITPWNFPLAIPAWKTFPALVAGNAVVLKPASDTPLLALKLAEVLTEAGLPPGVLNIITGPGGSLGEALARHKQVAMISLTGSTQVGRQVAEICGRDLRRCSLELGGKNAVVVLDDGDLDLAAESVTWAAFGTTGQRCTATSRVIVQRGALQGFIDRLVAAAEKLRVGDGLSPATEMGPLVNRERVRAVHEYTEIGKREGARLLTGGMPLTQGEYSEGAFYQPTIFSDVTLDMRIAREEIFGPFVSIIPVDTYDEAIHVVNSSNYGLSTAVFTESSRLTFRAMREIVSGLIYFNAGTTGSEIHLPFGGMKASGNGHRELGGLAVDEFSEIKSVYICYPAKK
jgi:aldehyde dehydrogenase (NAD+)